MFKHKLLMDQTQGQESSGSAAQSTQATTTTNSTEAQGQSTGTIEQMYGETQTTQQTQATQTQQATKTEAGKEGTASGYEAPPAGTGSGYTDPTKDQQQQQTTETTQSKAEFDETGLSPEAIKEIKDFAAANKLSKEATEQYAKVIKGQAGLIENFKKEQEKIVNDARLKQRNEWYNQLKSDKDFGGDQFEANIKRVDTILEKFMPNTKNMLTSRKAMLPPDVMKDLHGLFKVLLGSDDKFVNGNTTADADAGLNEDEKFLKNYYK